MRTRLIWALAVLALVVAACSPGDASGGQLDGTDWVLRSYELDGTLTIVPDNLYADAEFAAQRVRGFSGCNEFDALYRAGGRTLFVSQAAVTLRACDEETMAFEQAVLGLLNSSRTYTARRDTLTIYGEGRNELLVYDAAPRNPVRGEWQVTAFNNGAGAVTSVIADTEIDIAFGLASVGGFAGCNSFSGTYGTNGNIIRIGALATTRIACDQEVMDQETAFLEALQGVAFIETRGQQVNLTDLRGAIKVTLIRPEPVAPASPGPSAEPTSEPTSEPSKTPKPTPKPTPTPTPKPTPTPSPAASPTPTAGASTAPSALPSIEPPPGVTVSTCDVVASGETLATISYAATWFTLTSPADLACRYFDPSEITVPSDPSTLVTDVMISVASTPYDEAVTAAEDPASWTVSQSQEYLVNNVPATLVEAQAVADTDGVPAGSWRFAYLVNLGSAGTLTMFTTGSTNDEAYDTRSAIVTLMMEAAVFAPVD